VECCKASLAALRLYGYFCDFVVLLSENKYDDDESINVKRFQFQKTEPTR